MCGSVGEGAPGRRPCSGSLYTCRKHFNVLSPPPKPFHSSIRFTKKQRFPETIISPSKPIPAHPAPGALLLGEAADNLRLEDHPAPLRLAAGREPLGKLLGPAGPGPQIRPLIGPSGGVTHGKGVGSVRAGVHQRACALWSECVIDSRGCVRVRGPKGANLAPRVWWDSSVLGVGGSAWKRPRACAAGAQGSGPPGRGIPSSPRSSIPGTKGLFRSEPWESVSPVEVISPESARRGCKSPPAPHRTTPPPPAALWSRGGGAGTPGGAGLGLRPPEARGRSWIGRLRSGGGG
uniref:Uncharacterized protein n=1 Tax=Rangifer tarandus platyrhynchus TaxID=3082113 RepID=A0ACB0EER8_RANTA|nr:unnamed protein product [Rangifer tarandus platyrhynchus]